MHFVNRLTIAVIFCLSFTFISTEKATANDWYKYETDSFILYSDLAPEDGNALAKDLELFRFYLGRMTGITPQPELTKLPVFAFSKGQDFQYIIQNQRIGGLFSRQVGKTYAIANIARSSYRHSDSGVSTIFHEYVHYFMDRYAFASYPPWYREGLADFLSTFERDGNEVTLGRPLPSRIQVLKYARVDFLKDLLEYRWGRFSLHGKNDVTMYLYSWGWLLTHMLHMNEEFRPHVNELMQALNSGMDVEEAFEQKLGFSVRYIERKMKAFQRSGRLTLLTGEVPSISRNPIINQRRLNEGEIRLMLFELRENFTGGDDAHTELLNDVDSSAQLNANSIEKTLLRAKILSHLENWNEAFAMVDAILANNPTHEAAVLLRTEMAFSKIAIENAEREKDARSADDYDEDSDEEFELSPQVIEANNNVYEQERQRLLPFLQVAPNNVLANYMLASTHRQQKTGDYFQEATHWMRALRGQPQSESLRFGLARALADLGETTQSCVFLTAVVKSFISYSSWQEVDKVMEKIEEQGETCALPEVMRPDPPEHENEGDDDD